MDALLRRTFTKTFTIDAFLRKTFTKTFTLDALLLKTRTKTFTLDSILKKTQTKTFSIDASLKKTQAKTFTLDAILQTAGVVTRTKTFKIGAILLQQSGGKRHVSVPKRKRPLPPTIYAPRGKQIFTVWNTVTAKIVLTDQQRISLISKLVRTDIGIMKSLLVLLESVGIKQRLKYRLESSLTAKLVVKHESQVAWYSRYKFPKPLWEHGLMRNFIGRATGEVTSPKLVITHLAAFWPSADRLVLNRLWQSIEKLHIPSFDTISHSGVTAFSRLSRKEMARSKVVSKTVVKQEGVVTASLDAEFYEIQKMLEMLDSIDSSIKALEDMEEL